MKKGKFIKLGTHNNVKIGYGTTDYRNLKTIYIQLNSWTQPKEDNYDYLKIISKVNKLLKQHIYNLNNVYFKKESIVDLDIKTSSIKTNKKSFMDLEITLYIEKKIDIKSKEIKKIINDLSVFIVDNILTDEILFNFYTKKN
jgi:hypothetical protein